MIKKPFQSTTQVAVFSMVLLFVSLLIIGWHVMYYQKDNNNQFIYLLIWIVNLHIYIYSIIEIDSIDNFIVNGFTQKNIYSLSCYTTYHK